MGKKRLLTQGKNKVFVDSWFLKLKNLIEYWTIVKFVYVMSILLSFLKWRNYYGF